MNSADGGRGGGRPVPPTRDQGESAFAPILRALVGRVGGALSAILVDGEGEAVDYAGVLDAFSARLAGAHWRIVLNDLIRARANATLWIAVGALRRSYIAWALPDGYALVVVLTRTAAFTGWERALRVCVAGIAEEAGWMGIRPPEWFAASVATHADGRPVALCLGERELSLEILGVVAKGLAPEERGWRVRLSSGAEATLIREASGNWYADEPVF